MLAGSAPRPLILVLVGHVGVGKSSTANTLLGRNEFVSRRSAAAITSSCQSETTTVNGREICIVDTPGMGDPEVPAAELRAEISRGFKEITEEYGGDGGAEIVLLLVLQVGARVNVEHLVAFGTLGSCFGLQFYQRTMAVFTHGDLLQGSTLQQFLEEGGDSIQSFLRDIAGGSMLINNSVELRPRLADQPNPSEPMRPSSGCEAALAETLAVAATLKSQVLIKQPTPRRKAAR